jgi:alpha-mannosidase
VTGIPSIDRLLEALAGRIWTPAGHRIPLRFRTATAEDRRQALAGPRDDWAAVDRDLIWGEPDGYYWFAGAIALPSDLEGRRVFVRVEAAFGSVMGRSDPQCLVRVNGRIAQGVDGNHREFLLTEQARAGESFEIVIEAGTIEDRRQLGFACELVVHDQRAQKVYYDLRVPGEVARLLQPDDPRRHFIFNRVEKALGLLDLRPGDAARFAKSLDAAEAVADEIYAAADSASMPAIVATGHTHIDVAWLWRVRETRQKMARSMATALALMDEYPDYRFMYNQCVLLDYLQADYPELFDRIGERVRSGQFEIEGALWLEPDVNVTGGEALIRHILHGVRYHQRTFGVRPRIMWLPDTFGYSAALPQLMEKSGLDTFITHKLSWNDTNRMPFETFHWKGIDGTSVAAYFLTTQPYDSKSIGTTYCPNLKPTHVMGAWRRHGQQPLNDELFLVYGHGDGGGGPTREMLENVRRMERGIPGCPKIRHEPMRPFFERLLDRMRAAPERYPTWVGELYLEFHRGTLTSVAKNKRNNRRAEQALRELETLASMALHDGAADYPSDELWELWQIVLLNQFHDILPGSSIGAVFDDSDADYAQFFERAAALHDRLASVLVAGEAVFNGLGRTRGGLVSLARERAGAQAIVRADGSAEWVLQVADVPAMGFGPLRAAAPSDDLSVTARHIENELIKASFDSAGRLTSLYDKRRGREALKPGQTGNRLAAYRDLPAQYDAWDIDRSFEDQSWEIDDLVSAEIAETGPYRAALRFEWRYEHSRIVQVVSLAAGADRLEFDTFVDWHEHNTLLKAGFPLAVNADAVHAEIQFSHVRRATHANTSWDEARYECSMQRWVEVGEPDFGVAFLNDCKYGYDARGADIRLTLLRSPTYPWPEADQGEHRFRYAVMLHHGLAASDVPGAAEAFNAPLQLLAGSARTQAAPLAGVSGDGVTIESIKKSEDGSDLIVRLWETHGRRTSAELRLPAGTAGVVAVDLLEQEEGALPATNGTVALDFLPFEIKSLKLRRS